MKMFEIDEIDEDLKAFRDKIVQRYDELRANTIEQQIDVFTKHLSEAAIDSMIAHYSSKEGIEIVEKMPEISADLARLSIDMNKSLMDEFMNEIKRQADQDYYGFDPGDTTTLKPQPKPGSEEDMDDFFKRYGIL